MGLLNQSFSIPVLMDTFVSRKPQWLVTDSKWSPAPGMQRPVRCWLDHPFWPHVSQAECYSSAGEATWPQRLTPQALRRRPPTELSTSHHHHHWVDSLPPSFSSAFPSSGSHCALYLSELLIYKLCLKLDLKEWGANGGNSVDLHFQAVLAIMILFFWYPR